MSREAGALFAPAFADRVAFLADFRGWLGRDVPLALVFAFIIGMMA